MVCDNFHSHETICDTAADILGRLRLKITIKRTFSAAK
jgi:hypothetical protein